jgi:hypothetical protein
MSLIDPQKGEQTAQACAIARLQQLTSEKPGVRKPGVKRIAIIAHILRYALILVARKRLNIILCHVFPDWDETWSL